MNKRIAEGMTEKVYREKTVSFIFIYLRNNHYPNTTEFKNL